MKAEKKITNCNYTSKLAMHLTLRQDICIALINSLQEHSWIMELLPEKV